jgi:hypothetical protein
MSGSWVYISRAEHRKIRTSKAMRDLVKQVADEIAKQANSKAGISDGYVTESPLSPNPDVTAKGDRARAHVWAKTGEAIRAEHKNAILMGIAAENGANHG